MGGVHTAGEHAQDRGDDGVAPAHQRRLGAPLGGGRAEVQLGAGTGRRVELPLAGRQLYEGIRPAWSQITAAFERAVDSGRGLTGALRVAFNGPAARQLLVGVTQLFRDRHPDCDVRIREADPSEVLPWLRAGEADLAPACHPVREEDVAMGPVLVREARMLAVPAGHPFARRAAPHPSESPALALRRRDGPRPRLQRRRP
ncbi:LysR family transcriptional regulator [Actinomycetota bacterium Odt1-20B]